MTISGGHQMLEERANQVYGRPRLAGETVTAYKERDKLMVPFKSLEEAMEFIARKRVEAMAGAEDVGEISAY